jgi:hypothetical protein
VYGPAATVGISTCIHYRATEVGTAACIYDHASEVVYLHVCDPAAGVGLSAYIRCGHRIVSRFYVAT